MKHFVLHPFPQYPECSLTAYLHDKSPELQINARRTVIVCPGGGYAFLSEREAEPIALQFLAQGLNVFILRYSICENAANSRPLIEACMTVKYLRERAEEYDVDPRYIFINGYSAGGHLSASCGTMFDLPEIRAAVGCEDTDMHRPTGTVLSYPVIASNHYGHAGSFNLLCGNENASNEDRAYYSVEKHVNAKTAPAFIWHTAEDGLVPVQNSIVYAHALADHGVSFEMHIYPYGPHGLSLCNKETSYGQAMLERPECERWIIDAGRWMMNF